MFGGQVPRQSPLVRTHLPATALQPPPPIARPFTLPSLLMFRTRLSPLFAPPSQTLGMFGSFFFISSPGRVRKQDFVRVLSSPGPPAILFLQTLSCFPSEFTSGPIQDPSCRLMFARTPFPLFFLNQNIDSNFLPLFVFLEILVLWTDNLAFFLDRIFVFPLHRVTPHLSHGQHTQSRTF